MTDAVEQQIRRNAYRHEWLKEFPDGDDSDFERWLANRAWEVEAQRDAAWERLDKAIQWYTAAPARLISENVTETLVSVRALLSEQPDK